MFANGLGRKKHGKVGENSKWYFAATTTIKPVAFSRVPAVVVCVTQSTENIIIIRVKSFNRIKRGPGTHFIHSTNITVRVYRSAFDYICLGAAKICFPAALIIIMIINFYFIFFFCVILFYLFRQTCRRGGTARRRVVICRRTESVRHGFLRRYFIVFRATPPNGFRRITNRSSGLAAFYIRKIPSAPRLNLFV